ncbi:hypothetical protein EVB68_102 [Rhizobium phage RHph_Y2_6]|uniref:Uncharacterized protein n=1 Tax=Rhizobium phage RHph_Y2_6 TaxID=2509576 RepID=A0A7S5QZD6_9CAUD|nr:hypothetical protein PP748_gp094 [Rhizobium phage RHph_Y2_6]QIG68837.1 hypothetical protein EVB68_102 [Rhizobium phage RHph_Y2_6]
MPKDDPIEVVVERLGDAFYNAWHMIDLGNGNIGEEQDDEVTVRTKDIAAVINHIRLLESELEKFLMREYQGEGNEHQRCETDIQTTG